MSGHAGAKFVGGPEDGKAAMLPTGPDDIPPAFVIHLGIHAPGGDLDAPVEKVEHRYRREVSPDDDGPLWLYRYDDTTTAKKE